MEGFYDKEGKFVSHMKLLVSSLPESCIVSIVFIITMIKNVYSENIVLVKACV